MQGLRQIVLTGDSLSLEDVDVVMSRKQPFVVSMDADAHLRILESYTFIQNAAKSGKVIYGVTTGFGSLNNQVIAPADTALLQLNLIRSHAIGTGPAVAPPIVRGMLLLRLNCIAKGCSGVSLATVDTLIAALNNDVLPEVPEQGSVGASGDLCPLSHLMLGLIGEGRVLNPSSGRFEDAASVLQQFGIKPLVLGAKEGLALNNGTQFITSYLAQAYILASRVLEAGTIASALTLEMLHGTARAFDERISAVRPHSGQIAIAKQLREYLSPQSQIAKELVKNVQEAYSLRCIPQIHGTVLDLLQQAQTILNVEINSANDNPLIFGNEVLSGGNFHGQYPALASDLIAIAMSTLANVSERRLERLVNGNINIDKGQAKKHIPSFLVDNAGLNSGLMILQYQAAALAAENRHLAAPASVHTIPTCENQEDVVSMGGWSARKALQSSKNCARVVAAELYAGAMASHYTEQKTTEFLQQIIGKINPVRMTVDRYFKPEVDAVVHLVEDGQL